MAIISCRGVTMSYERNVVFSRLTFDVGRGDYLCIVGENGSGKSTLVKGILGLKEPQDGEIVLGDGLRRREIGYLPQQTEIQRDFPASVGEVVRSGLLNRPGLPFYTRADRARALENMKKLEIDALGRRSYRELSGGQQQRALLARALCAAGNLILLDEPVAGLDPVVTEQMYVLLRHLNRTQGVTVVMVTHDVHCALLHAGSILHLGHDSYFYGTNDNYPGSDLGRAFLGGHDD